MDNSCDIAAAGGFRNPLATEGAPSLGGRITSRDGKGRLIQRGAHRDVPPRTSPLSGTEATGQPDSSEAHGRQPGPERVFIPMTNFEWEVPAVMVTSIPTDVTSRADVSI